ncbi:MAG: DUF58 domain-containing protein [Gammaproteobacteria bacterium]|nr:DUF58 domain-containing protein [Gammaproteobacteria bacterium]
MFGRKKQTTIRGVSSIPLMTGDEVLDYMQRGMSQMTLNVAAQTETMQKRSGEELSPFRGSGLDYEESRPYQAGDDLRNINWRLMARTNELYTKIFREERETSKIIVIDRRAAMRFGTRCHLKITRAVQIAAYLAGVSIKQGYSVGGVVMQPESVWGEPQRSRSKILAWLSNVAEHCEVLNDSPSTPELSSLLSQLHLRLVSGSQIVLISDFHDLNETHKAILSELSQMHNLLAIQVLDPAEEILPATGAWPINAYDSEQYITLHADDMMRKTYSQAAQQKIQDLQALFASIQIPFVSTRTDQDFDEIVRQLTYV